MTPKLRSIPKARTRLIARSAESRERAEFLRYRETYRTKEQQFQHDIADKAHALQDLRQHESDVTTKLHELNEHHEHFNTARKHLNRDVVALLTDFRQQITQASNRIESLRAQETAEHQALATLQAEVETWTAEVATVRAAAAELYKVVEQEQAAYLRLQALKDEIDALQAQSKTLRKEREQQQAELDEQTAALEAKAADVSHTEQEITKLWGNLHAYNERVRQATMQLNQDFKQKGLPIQYEIPPEQLTVVPFPRKR